MKNINMIVKNPLGVISLFVTFIDGIAGLVISVNFEHLHGAAERLLVAYTNEEINKKLM